MLNLGQIHWKVAELGLETAALYTVNELQDAAVRTQPWRPRCGEKFQTARSGPKRREKKLSTLGRYDHFDKHALKAL